MRRKNAFTAPNRFFANSLRFWPASSQRFGAVKAFFRRNDPRRARRNVAHHYDLSDELYETFLDPDRQYSCAYYTDPRNSLEQAQADKKAHIAAKLHLRPGQRVLDIGSPKLPSLFLAARLGAKVHATDPVSYTHLTLPTIYSV